MQLVTVETKKERQEFLDAARTIYTDDPYWVCPLDREIQGIFDPAKNKKFLDGQARRWILKDDQGQGIYFKSRGVLA